MRFLIVFFIFFACKVEPEETASKEHNKSDIEMFFEKVKWKTKNGEDYPYRDKMLDDVVYNDTIRDLNESELVRLLGEPNRIQDDHLYYTITRKSLGFWTLHTKSMVIKLSEDKSIEWIKIHE